jgi:hypothetical protein
MHRWSKKWALGQAVLVAALGLVASAARAEPPCLPPPPPLPNCPAPSVPGGEGTGQPAQQPGQQPATTDTAALPERGGGAGIGSTAELDPGYIDPAAPRTQFRVRYDSFRGDNRPDRADFFYPKCGCFATQSRTQPFFDPNAKGPPLPERKVNAQELSFYGEYAVTDRFSGFFELPLRYLQPENNVDANGISDINFGFKYALVCEQERILSFQLRAYAPTGDPFKGLGTNNWALEPALLFERQLTDRVALLAELRDTIPIASDDDFAGNVLRYGVGVSVLAYCGERVRVAPVVEMVGWTVLNGKEFAPDIPSVVKNAGGDTIVNVKFGVRLNFGDTSGGGGFLSHSDLYVGYGHALTGDVWYKDIVRVEYRLRF